MNTQEINNAVMEHQKLIWKLVNRKVRLEPGWDRDDLFQTAFFGARRAVIDYRAEEGVKLSTFIYKYVRNEIRSYCKVQRRYRRKFITNTIHAQRRNFSRLYSTSFEDSIMNKDGASKILNILSEKELELVDNCIIGDLSLRQYSMARGVSEGVMSYRMIKLKRKFHKYMPEFL